MTVWLVDWVLAIARSLFFKCRPLLLALVVCKEICGRFPCFGKNLKIFPSQISCKVSYLCFKIDLSCCFRLVFFLSFRKLTILCLPCLFSQVTSLSGIDTGVVYSRKPTYLDSQAHIHWLEIRCAPHTSQVSHKLSQTSIYRLEMSVWVTSQTERVIVL